MKSRILMVLFLALLILCTIKGMTYFESMVATGLGAIMMLILESEGE